MSKPIRFTQHARRKFDDLAILGFVVSEEQVLDAVRDPDKVDHEASPPIAQKAISESHVLRVVFVDDPDEIRIVTFYPGRRTRYESQDAL